MYNRKVNRMDRSVLYLVSYVIDGVVLFFFFFLMIRRPPRSTQSRSSAASDVYKRQSVRYGFNWQDIFRLGTDVPDLAEHYDVYCCRDPDLPGNREKL